MMPGFLFSSSFFFILFEVQSEIYASLQLHTPAPRQEDPHVGLDLPPGCCLRSLVQKAIPKGLEPSISTSGGWRLIH